MLGIQRLQAAELYGSEPLAPKVGKLNCREFGLSIYWVERCLCIHGDLGSAFEDEKEFTFETPRTPSFQISPPAAWRTGLSVIPRPCAIPVVNHTLIGPPRIPPSREIDVSRICHV